MYFKDEIVLLLHSYTSLPLPKW